MACRCIKVTNPAQGPTCTKEAKLRKSNRLTRYDNRLEKLGTKIFRSNPSLTCASRKLNPIINEDCTKSWKIKLSNRLDPLANRLADTNRKYLIWFSINIIYIEYLSGIHNQIFRWHTINMYASITISSISYLLASFLMWVSLLVISIIMTSSNQTSIETLRTNTFTIRLINHKQEEKMIILAKKVIQP